MSTHTAHTHTYGSLRPAAGQRARADSPMMKENPEKHSLESLIGDIDTYIAEQEAYERDSWDEERPGMGRPRSDSRGTMFVDMDEGGAMVVSYRYPLEPTPALPARSPRRDELPEGELYVVDGQEVGAAPYMQDEDGASFVRVGVSADGKGIYVPKREGGRYGVGGHSRPRHRRGPRARSNSAQRPQYRCSPYPTTTAHRRPHCTALPSDLDAGSTEGEYPRPMRRVENNINIDVDKPLPRLPQSGYRKRRSFVEVIRRVMRKLCSSSRPAQGKKGKVYGVEQRDGSRVLTRRPS
ncbi:uncharacterized protein CC84DRAFT_1224979 [Paraphaeosphaeria sporulosa]|uniref:Uncharacterized protein n=1 Tax=Paraphaeosphaeria sporulosa TaxID=1460663 RepID=A0A177CWU2_9PLEO|nr:uncharacterized protein CC84DRAFT_1224979 [Paraphaeosphaeria sporulosa]OAG11686.1 hypothetical protein CC84DRAFT_1224979 [Paraphaeosphaeria sporulosa]